MKRAGEPRILSILPVSRSKKEAKQVYDCISRFYGYLTRPFERKYAEMALEYLSIQQGETVLEVGFGPGYCLKRIAESVGQTGKVHGVDISSGMLGVAKRRLEKAQLMGRAELCCGDAAKLPYGNHIFDAVFMSFTLELFDTPEIPQVLEEVNRVLRPGGRLGMVSMSRSYGESTILRLYERSHKRWPKYIDCRPIYVERSLIDAGYIIRSKQKARLIGLLPLELVVAVKIGRS